MKDDKKIVQDKIEVSCLKQDNNIKITEKENSGAYKKRKFALVYLILIIFTLSVLGLYLLGVTDPKTFQKNLDFMMSITSLSLINDQFSIQTTYNLIIVDPTTSNPKNVDEGDNITIRFDALKDGTNLTSSVEVLNVTVGGLFAVIVPYLRGAYNSTLFYDPFNVLDNNWTPSTGGVWNIKNNKLHSANCGSNTTLTLKSFNLNSYDDAYIIFLYHEGTGNLELNDCVYYSFYNGISWSSWTPLFCDDIGTTFRNKIIKIPQAYLVNDFKFRFECRNFEGGGEDFYADNFKINGSKNSGEYTTWYDDRWYVNVTVPLGLLGFQDLFLNATYKTDNITIEDTQTNAINYRDQPPNVILESPADNYASLNSELIFNCSAIDDVGLINITLYGNWSEGWHDNETKSLTGISNSTTFTLNISDGAYEWNCLAYDTGGSFDWADNNRTFTINTADYNFTYVINETEMVIYSYRTGILENLFYDNLIYALRLIDEKNKGTYVSQVFNTDLSVSWKNISWVSNAIGEILNVQGETEFTNGSANLTDNILLMHMNEDGVNGTTIIDYSSQGNNGTLYLNSISQNITTIGKFYTALNFDGVDDYAGLSFNLNQWMGGTASLSAWIKTNQTGDSTMWLAPGITGVESSGFSNDIFWGWIDDTGRIGIQAGNVDGAKSYNPINDDEWYHVVLTRDSSSGEVRVYIDGNLDGTAISDTGTKATPFYSIGRIEDTLGSHEYFEGIIDEIGMWNRILSDQEILNLYKRGIMKLNLSVRSCDDKNCIGENFIDIDDVPQDLSVNNNRHFQYKFDFDTENITYYPELYNVTINYFLTKIKNILTIRSGTLPQNSTLVLINSQGETIYNQTNINHTLDIEQGTYNITFTPTDQPMEIRIIDALITEETINSLPSDNDVYILIDIDNATGIENNTQWENVHGIQPYLDEATSYTLTSRASGGKALYKCDSWNFTARICPDCDIVDYENCSAWKRIGFLETGEYYVTSFNITDPGFAEGNVTDGYYAAETGFSSASPIAAGYFPIIFGHIRGFVKFNFTLPPACNEIIDATLNLTVLNGNNDGGSKEILIVRVGYDDTVSEDSRAYSDADNYANMTLNTSSGTRDWISGETLSFNVTNLIKEDANLGEDQASFVLLDAENDPLVNNNAPGLDFVSFYDDTSVFPPTLEIIHADITPPSVTELIPLEDSNFTQNSIIEITAKVTDNCGIVDTILANISLNDTSELLNMHSKGNNTYQANFTVDCDAETYNFMIIANDTENNTNNTETSYFNIINFPPDVVIISPVAGTIYDEKDVVGIKVNATDSCGVDTVLANVIWDATSELIVLTNGDGNLYEGDFEDTSDTGIYNITIIASDALNDLNDTETTHFIVGRCEKCIRTRIQASVTAPVIEAGEKALVSVNLQFPDGELVKQDNLSSINISLYRIEGNNNYTILDDESMVPFIEGVWYYEFYIGDNQTGTYLAHIAATTNEIIPELLNEFVTFYIGPRGTLSIEGISPDLIQINKPVRLAAEVRKDGEPIQPDKLGSASLIIEEINGSIKYFDLMSGLVATDGLIYLDGVFNSSALYYLNWSINYYGREKTAKEIIIAVGWDEKLENISISSNVSSIVDILIQNKNYLLEVLRDMELLQDFSYEEIFLITDAVQSMTEVIGDLNEGAITPEEAEVRYEKIKGDLEKGIRQPLGLTVFPSSTEGSRLLDLIKKIEQKSMKRKDRILYVTLPIIIILFVIFTLRRLKRKKYLKKVPEVFRYSIDKINTLRRKISKKQPVIVEEKKEHQDLDTEQQPKFKHGKILFRKKTPIIIEEKKRKPEASETIIEEVKKPVIKEEVKLVVKEKEPHILLPYESQGIEIQKSREPEEFPGFFDFYLKKMFLSSKRKKQNLVRSILFKTRKKEFPGFLKFYTDKIESIFSSEEPREILNREQVLRKDILNLRELLEVLKVIKQSTKDGLIEKELQKQITILKDLKKKAGFDLTNKPIDKQKQIIREVKLKIEEIKAILKVIELNTDDPVIKKAIKKEIDRFEEE